MRQPFSGSVSRGPEIGRLAKTASYTGGGTPLLLNQAVLDSAGGRHGGGSLVSVQPGSLRIAQRWTLPFAAELPGPASGSAIWVVAADCVYLIAPRTRTLLRRIATPPGVGLIARAGSSLWIATASGLVRRTTMRRGAVSVSVVDLGRSVDALAGTATTLWALVGTPTRVVALPVR